MNDKAVGRTVLGKTKRNSGWMCALLKVMSYSLWTLLCQSFCHITYCIPIILHLLNCITETMQVTEGRKYFPRRLHVGQPCFKWSYSGSNFIKLWVTDNLFLNEMWRWLQIVNGHWIGSRIFSLFDVKIPNMQKKNTKISYPEARHSLEPSTNVTRPKR